MAVIAGRRSGLASPLEALRSLRQHVAGLPYYWQALLVVIPGAFMVSLNMTVVIVAFPRIIQSLQTTVEQGQLIMTGYMMALAVAMPATAYAAETFGAKRTYLTSVALFSVGSALCVIAPSVEALIVCRVLQGLGGSMVMPLGMTMLLQAAPPRARGSIMGLYGLPMLMAPVVGPIVGGFLVENVGWRPIFGMVIPAGIASLVLGNAILRESTKRPGARFDLLGFVVAAVGCSAALAALSRAPNDGWLAPHIVALWLIVAATMPCWVLIELYRAEPMLDLRVFRDRTYALALLVSVLAMFVLFSTYVLLPLFLQNVRGLSPLETGLLVVPEAIAAAIAMPLAGRLLDRVGPRPLIAPGLACFGVACWLLAGIDLDTPDTTLRNILILKGVAMGCVFMPISTTAMDSLPPALLARGAVLLNVVRQITGALGTAVFTSVLIERQNLHQTQLAQRVTAESIPVFQLLSRTTEALVQAGYGRAAAEMASLDVLAKQVNQAATIRAYDDCFLIASFIAFAAIVPLLMIRRTRRS